MNRNLFSITEFTKESFPEYTCPRCNSHLAWGEFSDEDNAETRIASSDPDFESDWVRRGFRADLKCSSSRCGERVLCVGTGVVNHISGEFQGGWHEEWVDTWTPNFFLPSLKVFEMPPNTPPNVRSSVWASFRVLFLSSGSALNEVRNALEFLMDHLEVPRIAAGGKALALHKRVEMMPQTHVQYRDNLLAVKWLGNAGTHSDPTRRTDVLDAYDILHDVLDGMFSGRADRLKRLVDQINSQKAPVN